ncbi:hypothetical protein [uncultured Cyclobacterium sp.]|uniref:hypothetical protein n=1 Tax=uncultured Cyclobacterium sp. TaxID=453820 RepID=UPI0030ECE71E|tara:strand:+ start:109284 stop:110204 length:921 start_codon:yes stop_codon:yes gene_type:complete
MNRFIIKLLIFSIFPIGTLYAVFLLENGTADPFYQRFTTPKQHALILGNSKAALGILPSILNDRLGEIYPAKLYNYSFTVYNSPYGPAYLESIKNKLANFEGNRCFIITVDPWSISSDIKDPNNPDKFAENERFISNVKNVNVSPNHEYLKEWFSKSYYEIVLLRFKNKSWKLHKDGWFETIGAIRESTINKNRDFMVTFYEDYLTKYSYSSKRYEYLQETISYLKSRGAVYLVRMPLHQDIFEIENKLDPEFNAKMINLAEQYNLIYFNFNELSKSWKFTDGLHLTVESAKDLSNLLSDNILLNN